MRPDDEAEGGRWLRQADEDLLTARRLIQLDRYADAYDLDSADRAVAAAATIVEVCSELSRLKESTTPSAAPR